MTVRDQELDPPRPQPTGRTLVLFKDGVDGPGASRTLKNDSGVSSTDSREFKSSSTHLEATLTAGTAVVFPRFGAAIVPAQAASMKTLSDETAASGTVLEVRPEFYLFAIGDSFAAKPTFGDTEQRTWGIAATGVESSKFTGRGIKIAILDTGFDLRHPDFSGRKIVSQSFVPGQSEQDLQGHGTHCAGTAAGPGKTAHHPRYGVAPDAELHVGKVLANDGSGAEIWVLNGMEWAIASGCHVISMSLGRAVGLGEKPDRLYERAGRSAWSAGCLIVAAAGNESSRQYNYIAPVGSPANSASIMAVAAIDQALAVAEFSCGGLNAGGGEIDLAGPGVGIHSSFPMPQRYKKLRGTSMACPHVAGIAALWAESDPKLRGEDLMKAMKSAARPLPHPARDVGAGLVSAPDPAVA